MRLLLDTHVALAVVEGRRSGLGDSIRSALDHPQNESFCSVASLWEIAIKTRLGKLPLRTGLDRLPATLESFAVAIVPITAGHAVAEANPVPDTRDPFDRLLLAQCHVENMRLVTLDRVLAAHPMAWHAS